jgi:hypothetical protein
MLAESQLQQPQCATTTAGERNLNFQPREFLGFPDQTLNLLPSLADPKKQQRSNESESEESKHKREKKRESFSCPASLRLSLQQSLCFYDARGGSFTSLEAVASTDLGFSDGASTCPNLHGEWNGQSSKSARVASLALPLCLRRIRMWNTATDLGPGKGFKVPSTLLLRRRPKSGAENLS